MKNLIGLLVSIKVSGSTAAVLSPVGSQFLVKIPAVHFYKNHDSPTAGQAPSSAARRTLTPANLGSCLGHII